MKKAMFELLPVGVSGLCLVSLAPVLHAHEQSLSLSAPDLYLAVVAARGQQRVVRIRAEDVVVVLELAVPEQPWLARRRLVGHIRVRDDLFTPADGEKAPLLVVEDHSGDLVLVDSLKLLDAEAVGDVPGLYGAIARPGEPNTGEKAFS